MNIEANRCIICTIWRLAKFLKNLRVKLLRFSTLISYLLGTLEQSSWLALNLSWEHWIRRSCVADFVMSESPNIPEKKPSWWKLFSEFVEDTTFHGLRYLSFEGWKYIIRRYVLHLRFMQMINTLSISVNNISW